jgi:hypothetical protein
MLMIVRKTSLIFEIGKTLRRVLTLESAPAFNCSFNPEPTATDGQAAGLRSIVQDGQTVPANAPFQRHDTISNLSVRRRWLRV